MHGALRRADGCTLWTPFLHSVAMTRGLPITNRIALAEILRDAADVVERRVLADVD
jgi:hypothetical protein